MNRLLLPLLLLLLAVPGQAADAPSKVPKLPVVSLEPQVRVTPVVRQDAILSQKQRDTVEEFLQRQSLIPDANFTGDGHIVASMNNHRLIGMYDLVALTFNSPVTVGEELAIYRRGKPLMDPMAKITRYFQNDEPGHGMVINHLGVVRVEEVNPTGVIGRVTKFFEDIEEGDLLTRMQPINTHFPIRTELPEPLEGTILDVEGDHNAASAYQIVTVGVGRRDRALQGSVLEVWRPGRKATDPFNREAVVLPTAKVGSAILVYVGEKASYALLVKSSEEVEKGFKLISAP